MLYTAAAQPTPPPAAAEAGPGLCGGARLGGGSGGRRGGARTPAASGASVRRPRPASSDAGSRGQRLCLLPRGSAPRPSRLQNFCSGNAYKTQRPRVRDEGRSGTHTHTHTHTHTQKHTASRAPSCGHLAPARGKDTCPRTEGQRLPASGRRPVKRLSGPPSPPATTGPPHTSNGRPSGQEGGLGADAGPGRPLWACSFSPASHVDAIRVLPSRVRRSRSTAEGSGHTGTWALRAGVAKGAHGSSLGSPVRSGPFAFPREVWSLNVLNGFSMLESV